MLKKRRDDPHALVVGMLGVKMGDRIAQIGCADGARLAAVAAKVGLSGRAVAIVPGEEAGARVRKGAEREGVLIEIESAPPTRLPTEDEAFDLVVIDDTDGLLEHLSPEARAEAVREVFRILRGGGRVMVVGALPRTGLGALGTIFGKAQSASIDAAPLLSSGEFKAVRTLAEREGLRFVEALKPIAPRS